MFMRSDQHRVMVENLSASGMLLELPAGVTPGHFMRLQFRLGPDGRWVQLDALFARRDYEAGRQRWGVRFIEPPRTFAEALARHAETVDHPPDLWANTCGDAPKGDQTSRAEGPDAPGDDTPPGDQAPDPEPPDRPHRSRIWG